MSRTVRNMLRYHNAPSVKWYKPGRWQLDEAALRAGRPKVTTFKRYNRETYMAAEYDQVKVARKYVDEYGKLVEYEYTDYIDTFRERTRRVPNPEFNHDEYDAFWIWEMVHRWVYRNGTCRRQRKNAVRLAKMAASRARRNEDKVILARELKMWFDELSNPERDCSDEMAEIGRDMKEHDNA